MHPKCGRSDTFASSLRCDSDQITMHDAVFMRFSEGAGGQHKFVVDLPATHPGPGWRRKVGLGRLRWTLSDLLGSVRVVFGSAGHQNLGMPCGELIGICPARQLRLAMNSACLKWQASPTLLHKVCGLK